MDPVNWIYLPNLKFVALPVPEIIGGTQKNLGSPWIRPRSLFSPIFKGLLFAWALWICVPNLNFVALRVPEIIGGTQKNWAPFLDTPMLPFFQNFYGVVFGWTLWMYRPNLLSVALAVPEIIVIAGLQTPNLTEGGCRGSASKERLWLPIGSP